MKAFKPIKPGEEGYSEGHCSSCCKSTGYTCKVLKEEIGEDETDQPCWAFTNDPDWESKSERATNLYQGNLVKEGH